MCFIITSLAVVEVFSTKIINSTAVQAMWFEVNSLYLDHYTVYYHPNPAQNGGKKRQSNEQMANFPAGMPFGVIRELGEEREYLFSLAVTVNINGEMFEGSSTEPAPPG